MNLYDIAVDYCINSNILNPKYDMDNYPHYHHCPECYSKFECKLDCTIEPDLDEAGKRFGAHCECDPCEKKLKEEDKYKSKEFWDRYNGFVK